LNFYIIGEYEYYDFVLHQIYLEKYMIELSFYGNVLWLRNDEVNRMGSMPKIE